MGHFFGPAVEERRRQSYIADRIFQEGQALLQGIEERHVQVRPVDEQGQAGEAGAGPQIEDTSAFFEISRVITGQAVGHVLDGDAFRVGNGRQVHDFIRFHQFFIKSAELGKLPVCHGKAHGLQGLS